MERLPGLRVHLTPTWCPSHPRPLVKMDIMTVPSERWLSKNSKLVETISSFLLLHK
jgi:hypothetical protein